MSVKPLSVDYRAAWGRYLEALSIALSDEPVPKEWTARAREISDCASDTFVPMLGTALLAKATNKQVNALALKQSGGHRGYSARQLAKKVLVPLSVKHGIDLRTQGAEPLNNSPFYKEDMVSDSLRIRKKLRPELEHLVRILQSVDFLEDRAALMALAAFLRIRVELGDAPVKVSIASGEISFSALCKASESFLKTNREGGRRGQAFTAACLSMVYPRVVSGHINDPSAHFPGDIVLIDNRERGQMEEAMGNVLGAVEVKQRETTDTEVLQFAARLARSELKRGLYVIFDKLNGIESTMEIESLCQERHGVHMRVIVGVRQLLSEFLAWVPLEYELALDGLSRNLVAWLIEFHADSSSSEEWRSRVLAALS